MPRGDKAALLSAGLVRGGALQQQGTSGKPSTEDSRLGSGWGTLHCSEGSRDKGKGTSHTCVWCQGASKYNSCLLHDTPCCPDLLLGSTLVQVDLRLQRYEGQS